MSTDRQAVYLDALGITRWQLKTDSSEEPDAGEPFQEIVNETSAQVQHDDGAPVSVDALREQARLAASASTVSEVIGKAPVESVPAAPKQQAIQSLNIDELRTFVSTCQQCDLHKTRKQTVFGSGHAKADWLIIGEAPGADEDRQGEPFVGRAGKLLTQMLRAIGLAREEVYIANILKCRPPNNRDPKPEEVQACRSFLDRQIELIEPKIVLALGRIAAQSLLNTSTPIGKMRGQLYHLEKHQLPVVVTYHPAYLLRSPKEKRKTWEDLKFAREQVLSIQS